MNPRRRLRRAPRWPLAGKRSRCRARRSGRVRVPRLRRPPALPDRRPARRCAEPRPRRSRPARRLRRSMRVGPSRWPKSSPSPLGRVGAEVVRVGDDSDRGRGPSGRSMGPAIEETGR